MYILILLILGIQCITLFPYISGQNYFLIYDGINQYNHFFSELSHIIANKSSIFWSWHQGIGANFYGSMTYYLLSPIMLILILIFPTNSVPYLFVISFIIKQQLAGIAMFKLLKELKFSKTTCISISLLWSCNAYLLHYSDNPMWLDALVLLPMIFLGVEKIRNQRKFMLFTICIALAAITNYYLFFSISIFTYVYIIFMYIIRVEDFKFKKLIEYLLKMTGYYLIGVMISAIVLIPAVYAIKESPRGSGLYIPSLIKTNFDVLINTLKSGFFNTSENFYVLINQEGLIYSGNICIMLLPLLFWRKIKANYKIKVCAAIILIVELLSLFSMFIYMGFHAFMSPVCFHFRYMYGFIAFNLLIAAYVLEKIMKEKVDIKLLYIGIILIYTSILLYDKGIKIILPNLIIFIVYFCLLKFGNKKALIGVIAIELCFSTNMIINHYLPISLGSDFSKDVLYNQEISSLINSVNTDNELDRIYETFSLNNSERLRNIGMNYGFSGLSVFTSTDNKYYTEFLNSLNLRDVPNGVVNLTGNLMSNQILNVRYAILKNEAPIPYGYKIVNRSENYSIYENSNYMNGGYVTNNRISREAFDSLEPIEKELVLINNVIIDNLDKKMENYNINIGNKELDYKIISSNVGNDLKNIVTNGVSSPNIELSINQFSYKTSELFMDIASNLKVKSIQISEGNNQYTIQSGDFTSGTRLFDMGCYSQKAIIKINLLDDSTYNLNKLKFYEVDTETLQNEIDRMKNNSFNQLKAKSNKVSGEIDIKNSGTLFLSIPYNDGWKVYVDGNEIQSNKDNIAFISLDLDEGKHTIELEYISTGFYKGLIISILGFGILLLLIIMKKYKKSIKKV